MTVIDVHKDPDTLTMTVTSEFDARVDQVWQLWADPRRLERWWGPPTYPATFVDHELTRTVVPQRRDRPDPRAARVRTLPRHDRLLPRDVVVIEVEADREPAAAREQQRLLDREGGPERRAAEGEAPGVGVEEAGMRAGWSDRAGAPPGAF